MLPGYQTLVIKISLRRHSNAKFKENKTTTETRAVLSCFAIFITVFSEKKCLFNHTLKLNLV